MNFGGSGDDDLFAFSGECVKPKRPDFPTKTPAKGLPNPQTYTVDESKKNKK